MDEIKKVEEAIKLYKINQIMLKNVSDDAEKKNQAQIKYDESKKKLEELLKANSCSSLGCRLFQSK